MRAIVLKEHGGPEVLQREDLAVPVPGLHQLLVQVHATSVHGCRVLTTAGRPGSIAFCRDVLGADEVIDYAPRGPENGGESS